MYIRDHKDCLVAVEEVHGEYVRLSDSVLHDPQTMNLAYHHQIATLDHLVD